MGIKRQFHDESGSRIADNMRFRDEIDGHTDRAAAIIATVALDGMLSVMLEQFFVSDSLAKDFLSPEQPIGTFSAKIKLSYLVRLVNESVYKDLQLIRKIRNDFAHTLTLTGRSGKHEYLTFGSQSILDRCKLLTTPETHPPLDMQTIESNPALALSTRIPRLPPPTDPRERFIHTCETLIAVFLNAAVAFGNETPAIPRGSTITATFLDYTPPLDTQPSADPDQGVASDEQ